MTRIQPKGGICQNGLENLWRSTPLERVRQAHRHGVVSIQSHISHEITHVQNSTNLPRWKTVQNLKLRRVPNFRPAIGSPCSIEDFYEWAAKHTSRDNLKLYRTPKPVEGAEAPEPVTDFCGVCNHFAAMSCFMAANKKLCYVDDNGATKTKHYNPLPAGTVVELAGCSNE